MADERWLIPAFSFVAFQLFGATLERFEVAPRNLSAPERRTRWSNIFMSLVHSCLSSAGCAACLWFDPRLLADISEGHTALTARVVAFSWGYFVHDLVHTLLNRRLAAAWDILLHHVIVVCCFGVAVLHRRYLNFACASLICEFSSVLLHARQLRNMTQPSPRALLVANAVVYVVARLLTLAYMTLWLRRNRLLLSDAIYRLGAGGMVAMNVINLVLFKRLLAADWRRLVASSSLEPAAKAE